MISKIESATRWMENLANDNSHGYSQSNRWGPDYDCSSAVITAWEQAGVPVKSHGATYTGNMKGVFIACGFKDVTSGINLNTGAGLKRGDVCLNVVNHVVMYIGSGKIVHARSSEGNIWPGDQSGNEIRIQSYWNYPWDCILRYPETTNYDEPIDEKEDDPVTPEPTPSKPNALDADGIAGPKTWAALASGMPQIREGDCVYPKSEAVRALQNMLNYYGANLDPDGEFGPLTKEALISFQKAY